jgi:hypothetical protein
VFVALYGLTLLAMRLLLTALHGYARREQLYATGDDAASIATRNVLSVVAGYGIAILIGVLFPVVAVALYCAIAVALVVPVGEARRLLTRDR